MRDEVEGRIFAAVKKGEVVQYTVRAIYARGGSDMAPMKLLIEAYGNRGFSLRRELENPAGMFGIDN
jgi:hypothetical protein